MKTTFFAVMTLAACVFSSSNSKAQEEAWTTDRPIVNSQDSHEIFQGIEPLPEGPFLPPPELEFDLYLDVLELEWDILIEQMDLLYASETEYGLLKGIVVRNPADEFWNLDNFWTWDPDQWDDYDNNIPDHLKDIPENDRRDDE